MIALKKKEINEIQDYVAARYISAIEVVLHIYSFNMHGKDPSVIRLDFHLQDQNIIMFLDNDKIEKVSQTNKLVIWFKLNLFLSFSLRFWGKRILKEIQLFNTLQSMLIVQVVIFF